MRNECVFRLGSVGKAERSTDTTKSRVKNCPLSSVNKGRPAEYRRTRLKCHKADTGQSGDGTAKSDMCAPRAKRSVFDLGRNNEAAELSGAKDK